MDDRVCFAETVAKYHMLAPGDAVVAAVSGGADSSAMLHFFCALREKMQLTVCAAHFHHGLRGAQADADERFCREMCASWGVEFVCEHGDVRGEAEKTGESVEQCARRLRYAFLGKEAAKRGAKIATAHHLDDSLETMLLNLCRGTGLKGLCGIPPVRDGVIRPLIESTREEIERYCAENGIVFVTDETNADRRFCRNRLRLEAVPAMKQVNPSLLRAVRRTGEQLRADEALLEELTEDALERIRNENGIDCAACGALHPALKSRTLALFLRQAGGHPEAVHVRACETLLSAPGAVCVPGGVRACSDGATLCLKRDGGEKAGGEIPAPVSVKAAPGKTAWNGGELRMVGKDENVYNLLFYDPLDCGKIKGNLVLRGRQTGDSLAKAGRGCRKTLKKMFCEAKIPPEERDRIAVLADDEGVVWVSGFGCDERVKPGTADENVLYLAYFDENDRFFPEKRGKSLSHKRNEQE